MAAERANTAPARPQWLGPWRLDRSVGMWWRPSQFTARGFTCPDLRAFSLDGHVIWKEIHRAG